MRLAHKLLLVEDNDEVREVFVILLTSMGYSVTECANGISAIEKIQEESHDVAIIDLGLPDINGYHVASYIRQWQRTKTDQTILVALSGRNFVPSRKQSMEAGFDLHFAKPATVKTICSEIQTLRSAYQGSARAEAA